MKRGVYPVLQMPLDLNENIDSEILAKEIDWLIEQGVSGFTVAMVSEIMRFSSHERREQWQLVLKLVNRRLPVIVNIGAESTAIAVAQAKDAELDGVSVLMATPPAAHPSTSEEIYIYYKSIVEAVRIPLVVQDASNYMGQPLPMKLYADLLGEFGTERIQFKPEATPVKERVEEIQNIASGKALIFEGQSGMDLLDTHPLGLFGTMPASEIVWAVKALWDSLEKNDSNQAQDIYGGISGLIQYETSLDAYIAIEKYLLLKQGVFVSVKQRGPVVMVLDDKTKLLIDAAFANLEKIVKSYN
jgi:dihydrodipicolinate synthase/N-acetylneuraminate lyase